MLKMTTKSACMMWFKVKQKHSAEILGIGTKWLHLKIFNKEKFVRLSWFKTSIFVLRLWWLPIGNNSAYSFNPNMQLRWLFISSKDIVYFLSLDKYEHISKQTPFKEYQIVQHYERLILKITDLICLYTMRRISQLVFYVNKNLIWPGVQLWGVCIQVFQFHSQSMLCPEDVWIC